MPHWLKVGLWVAGGLFGLKLWNDSKALADQLKAKASTGKAVNFVGGHTLPAPTPSSAGEAVHTDEAGLANANPDTDFGNTYLGVAEGRDIPYIF